MLPSSVVAGPRTPAYHRFKHFLLSRGFTVFPMEFECVGSDHPYVDVAAKMGQQYWAFEYKSQNDSITRGVEQLRCYSQWFDYVVLVAEREVDHRSSRKYWDLKELGAGLWNFDPVSGRSIERSYPTMQQPIKENRRFVVRRFQRMRKGVSRALQSELDIFTGAQSQLTDFFVL